MFIALNVHARYNEYAYITLYSIYGTSIHICYVSRYTGTRPVAKYLARGFCRILGIKGRGLDCRILVFTNLACTNVRHVKTAQFHKLGLMVDI